MEKGSDDTLLGGFGDVFSALSNDKFAPSVSLNGFRDYSDDDDLSDEELESLKKNSKSPSVKDVFGADAPKGAAGGFFDALKGQAADEDEDEDEDEEEVKKPVEDPKKKTTPKKKVEPKVEEPVDDDDEDDEDNDNDDDTTGVEPSDKMGTAVSAFFDVIAEELGLEESEEGKPQTVEDLVDYFREVIAENSVPTYSNDEVKEIDEFVRNGGNLKDYFTITSDIDLDNLDLTSESNQELIVKEFLVEKGFTNTQIQRKLSKYKDADLLADEAEDALEAMKEIKAEKKEALLEAQKNQHQAMVEQQQNFINSVVEGVKSLDNVRGIKVPEKDKKILADYIFKKDANGMSQYQKDYAKDSIKNLLESAYFTMKGDTLIQAAEKDGKSAAMKALKQSLNSTGTGKGTKRIKTDTGSTKFSRAVQQLFGTN